MKSTDNPRFLMPETQGFGVVVVRIFGYRDSGCWVSAAQNFGFLRFLVFGSQDFEKSKAAADNTTPHTGGLRTCSV